MEEKTYQLVSDGRRLDVQLSEESCISRSRAAALMEEGYCLLEGKPCRKAGTKPPAGREVVLTVPAPKDAAPQAEDIPLEILYEDGDLAVVVKPRGMVVHPAAGHSEGTLVNALLGSLDELSGIGGEKRPGIVHRLDKDTSGVMMVAKNDETQTELSRMLKDREIEKHYLALAEGIMKEKEGVIEAPIGRSKKDRKKMAVDPDGRPAVTECAYPDGADPPDPGTYAEHPASGVRGSAVRIRKGCESALPDAARPESQLPAPADKGKKDLPGAPARGLPERSENERD